MSQFVYAFELRGIQGFLFNTGRLKDMIQASELIDYVFSSPLDAALTIVGVNPEEAQPRRAGGAAYLALDSHAQAQRLRDIWSLFVLQLLPGIELVDAIAEGDSVRAAVKAALDQLQVSRNQPSAQLPLATPITALAPRTGEPAVSKECKESLDLSTAVRRQAKRAGAGLMSRFGDDSLQWPNNFEADAHESRRFPVNADSFVGMLHLDGNGIGVLLRKLNEAASRFDDAAYINAYQTFSKGLEQVTCAAARKATEEILIPAQTEKGVMPARPIVLGGDDLTILLRSDVAVPFAQSFATHFELLSEEFIQQLKEVLKNSELPEKLTVSGGLVFVKPGFPFSQASALAESFAEIAKSVGVNANQEKVSALAMHRIQGATGDSATSLFEREHCVHGSGSEAGIELSLAAYGLTVGSEDVLPSISVLQRTVEACLTPVFSKARLRSLLDLLYQNIDMAKADYCRWRANMRKKDSAAVVFKAFEDNLSELVGVLDEDLPCTKALNAQGRRQTAIMDLMVLLEANMVSPLNCEAKELSNANE